MKYFPKQKRHFLFQILFVFLTLVSSRGFTHDFWLEAHPFYTMPEKSVDISVHVGNQFVGDSQPNIVIWYSDFSLYQADSKTDLLRFLSIPVAGTGSYSSGYAHSKWQLLALS
jgi:hypothetical protein